jgi:bifunctional DNase/RNase
MEVEIAGIFLTSERNNPVVLLKDPKTERFLPIWIGIFEANAISSRIDGVEYPRPLTHDLMRTIINGLKAQVVKIVIDELQDTTYYAKIIIEKDDELVQIDARPSDSIALAVRADCPIYVSEEVMSTGIKLSLKSKGKTLESELSKRLQRMDPNDFGKFRL